ncbi:DUF503 domain-containing protein [Nitratifractor salsuginis]|uniref:YlxP-like protein n=1 Tax=Nitratifractor salsuginis (strain DSM 16511 / JCM 12458 / E9I37-1) TaxID=749222 RepID=E6X031_NITSE|nr:DUF503 domain-containing protein [Nitratifractor salsuginis]ADV46754.1 protein of unknown function DUF503 [Nitratifractor salsuginis DSM 16511]
MILAQAIIHLELPEVHTLKGRRSVINSLKDRLKAFNISVLDISGSYAKEADIALAWLAHDARQSAQIRQSVERVLERHFGEYLWDLEFEEL